MGKGDAITAESTAGTIMRNYDRAFSFKEKESRMPLITRPNFSAHAQNRIWKGMALDDQRDMSAVPPSFQFWRSIRETLSLEGLDNEDFAEVLKDHFRMNHIACTEEQDLVPTGLWLLGCHELFLDDGLIAFYGRCLLRHFEGKDLRVRLLFRLPNQQVHFKFADGEEAIE